MTTHINTESTPQKRDMFWVWTIGISVIASLIMMIGFHVFMLNCTPMLIATPVAAAFSVLGTKIIGKKSDEGGIILYVLAVLALLIGIGVSTGATARTETIVHAPTQVTKTPNKVVLFIGDQIIESTYISVYTASKPRICQLRSLNYFNIQIADRWYDCVGGDK